MIDLTQEVLGTSVRIVTLEQSTLAEKAVEAAFLEAKRIEESYSRFIAGNDLAKLNAQVGEWTEVSEELFFLLETGKKLEELSGGAFSLSVKTVLESWGYNEKYELGKEFPELKKTGAFQLDSENQKVLLTAPVEVGALGKGYALDRMKEKLSDFSSIFLNAGGDIYARGKKADGSPWTCFFEHPEDANQLIGEVNVDDFFLTSSSPLKRKWRNRHHLIDARILEPANEMLATYIESKSGILADGYSTALFVSGYQAAKQIAFDQHIAAMLISKEGDIFKSAEFVGELYGR